MGTDSLKRQVPLLGAAAEMHFLFWNCACTRSFPHPQGPEQPFAVAACRLCCAPCMLSPECWHAALPSMGHCILPPCCLSARLHLSALSAETAQDMLEHRTVVKGASGDRLITIPATARGEIFDRQGHPRAFKDAERRGQEALSLPAQQVPYYWLPHTVPTWLFEGTLRAFRYSPTHISMPSNLRLQVLGCFLLKLVLGSSLDWNYRGNYFG